MLWMKICTDIILWWIAFQDNIYFVIAYDCMSLPWLCAWNSNFKMDWCHWMQQIKTQHIVIIVYSINYSDSWLHKFSTITTEMITVCNYSFDSLSQYTWDTWHCTLLHTMSFDGQPITYMIIQVPSHHDINVAYQQDR